MMDALEVKDLYETVHWLATTDRINNLAWPMTAKAITEIDLEIQLTVTNNMGLWKQKYTRYNRSRNL